MRAKLLVTLGLSAMLAAAACATVPAPPPARLANAKAAIRAAEELGANDVPEAHLRLQMANDQLQLSQKFTSEDKSKLAAEAVERAEAEAELAVVMTKLRHSRQAAADAQDKLRELRRSAVEGG